MTWRWNMGNLPSNAEVRMQKSKQKRRSNTPARSAEGRLSRGGAAAFGQVRAAGVAVVACGRPARLRGVPLGAAFGVLVAAGMFALYFGILRHSSVFGDTPAMVHRKLEEFGFDTPAAYWAFAGFLCVIHSLLEEYYWRWFVFGQLRRVAPAGAAILVSSFAFMAHHIIVLNVYFPGQFWTATLPFSLCVAGGGIIWAWLYDRSGSLLGPWLGHLLIDAAILVIGYDLVFVR